MAVLSARVSALNCGNAVEPISARSLTSEQAGQSGPRSLRTALEKLNAGCSELEVAQWLVDRPLIAGAMIWEMPDGQVLAYPEWSAQQKADLHKAVVDAEAWLKSWTPGTPVEPGTLPVNLAEAVLEQHDEAFTVWSPIDAWVKYLALVTHSLAVDRIGQVPWSLADLTGSELSVLFDARYFLIWAARCKNTSWEKTDQTLYARYHIDGYVVGFHKFGYKSFDQPGSGYATIPAAPRYLWSLLHSFIESGKVGEARRATVANVLAYLRGGLPEPVGPSGPPQHRGLSDIGASVQETWKYRGGAPLQRTLQGTYVTTIGGTEFVHVAYGHQGVVDVLRYTLQNLNVPVKDVTPAGYSMAVAWCMTEGVYMPNGDTFWAPLNPELPFVPPDQSMELLVDETRFKELHPPWNTISSADRDRNQNLPYYDAVIATLPEQLVRHYCCDKTDGCGRVTYDLQKCIGPGYTSVELAQRYPNLPARLEEKSAWWGCDKLMAAGCYTPSGGCQGKPKP